MKTPISRNPPRRPFFGLIHQAASPQAGCKTNLPLLAMERPTANSRIFENPDQDGHSAATVKFLKASFCKLLFHQDQRKFDDVLRRHDLHQCRRRQAFPQLGMSDNGVYPQRNSHLKTGNLISKTIGFFGLHNIFRETHIMSNYQVI